MTTTTKCPKGKAVFAATNPETGETSYRSSARDYTHALVVHYPARPSEAYIQQGNLVGEVDGPAMTEADVPEGAFDVARTEGRTTYRGGFFNPLVYADGSQMVTYSIEKWTRPTEESWALVSFHGSAELAHKAFSQHSRIADQYHVVPAEVVADRRVAR